jgi:pimeloyl-ACP methyl ester carboxylesterase
LKAGVNRSFLPIFIFVSFLFPSGTFGGEAPAFSRELHWAVTNEKFELALERLRMEKRSRHPTPVLLCHGLLVNSLLFSVGEDSGLAPFLAKEGFDVWNLSLRGTGRSLKPLKAGPESWSLDDMIERDLPAVIGHVQKETRSRNVIWLGYEVGGLLAYGYLEKRGRAGVAALVTIGTPVTFTHQEQELMKGLLRVDESPTLKKLFLYLNMSFLGRLLIPLIPKIEELFYNRENIHDEIKEKLLEDLLVDINPGILQHLLLIIRRGEFVSAKGDFNYRKNLTQIQIPILLIGGEGDKVAPPSAIRGVYEAVGSADRTLRIFGPRSKDSVAYGHIDLVLGKKALQEVFPVIGKWLKLHGAGH